MSHTPESVSIVRQPPPNRYRVLAIVALFAVSGCTEPTSPDSFPMRFVLTTIDGAALPRNYGGGGSTEYFAVGGSITLNRNGTYIDSLTTLYSYNGTTSSHRFFGEWEITDYRSLILEHPQRSRATWRGDMLEVVYGVLSEQTWVYQLDQNP